jgi:hypothetical protein
VREPEHCGCERESTAATENTSALESETGCVDEHTRTRKDTDDAKHSEHNASQTLLMKHMSLRVLMLPMLPMSSPSCTMSHHAATAATRAQVNAGAADVQDLENELHQSERKAR